MNRVGSLIFSDYRIQTPFFKGKTQFELYNPNCINTNSKHVCNMNSHFKDNIKGPFGAHDRIKTKYDKKLDSNRI